MRGPAKNKSESSRGSRRDSGNEGGIYSGVHSNEPKKVAPTGLLGLFLSKFKLKADIFVGVLSPMRDLSHFPGPLSLKGKTL